MQRSRTPPCVPGLPVLGNLLEYYRRPEPLLARGYKEHGPVFSLRLGPRRAVVLVGPACHQFFFRETDHALSIAATFGWLRPLFGDRFPLVIEGPRHLDDRRVLHRPLKGQHFSAYADHFTHHTQQWLDTLGASGEFELIGAVGRLILLNATRAFLGREMYDELGEEVIDLIGQIAHSSDDHLFRRLRVLLPTHPRYRAQLRLHEVTQKIIDERRRTGCRREDYLQFLMDASTQSGPFPDTDIINLAAGMVWGGHATSWGHLSWGLIQLLQNPEYLDAVMREQREVFGETGEIRADQLAELKHLDWALRETERMRPPVMVIGRLAVKDFEIEGYQVPRGWLALVAPPIAHRIPEVFADPDTYDPYRFAPGREEDAREPYALIGFGKGSHKCIGEHVAMLEMKLVLTMLLQRFRLVLKTPNPVRKPGPDPNRPQAPVMIGYERL